MSDLESSKSLAGIGALLIAFGGPVGIIGLILLFIGMKGLADYYNDHSIYQNAIWGLIFGIIGLVTAITIVFGFIWGSILSGLASASPTGIGYGLSVLGLIIVALVILCVFLVLAAVYFRRAFSSLAQKSGEHMFETAGLLLFIGAILSIILVGLLLMLIGLILAAVAFFSIRTPQTNVYTPPTQAYTQPTANRYCPNCGAPVEPNATYCPHCGKQLPPA